MNLEKFTTDLADQFEDSDRVKIKLDTNFKDLDGWDSLTTMLIIGMIKTDYDKEVSGAEIRNCNTVKELFEFIKNK